MHVKSKRTSVRPRSTQRHRLFQSPKSDRICGATSSQLTPVGVLVSVKAASREAAFSSFSLVTAPLPLALGSRDSCPHGLHRFWAANAELDIQAHVLSRNGGAEVSPAVSGWGRRAIAGEIGV